MKEFIIDLLLAVDQNYFEFIKIPNKIALNFNKKSLEELSCIVKRCKDSNIFIGILGSWALTMHIKQEFKNNEDIDLLTKDVYLRTLKETLLELGYKEIASCWPNMYCFTKNRINIDIFSIDNKQHIFYGLPIKIKDVEYQGVKYPVVSEKTLYQMYKKVFMKPKRSVKKDLMKFKILNKIKN